CQQRDKMIPPASSSGGAMKELTQVIRAIERGDRVASEKLLPLVYDELRRLAARKLAQEAPGQTLQATALVHEAYLRLIGNDADGVGTAWTSFGSGQSG